MKRIHYLTVLALGIVHLPFTVFGQVGAGGGDPTDRPPISTPLGAATLDTSNGNLTVSNIGSSGQDGVRFAMDDSLCFKTSLTIRSGGGPATVRGRSLATIEGNPDQPTAGFELSHDPGATNGNTSLRPAFGNVGADGTVLFEICTKVGESHLIPLPISKDPKATWTVDSFFDITYEIEVRAFGPKRDCEKNRPFCATGIKFPESMGEIPIQIAGRTLFGIGIKLVLIPCIWIRRSRPAWRITMRRRSSLG